MLRCSSADDLVFIQAEQARVLAYETLGEDAAGKLAKVLRFDSFQQLAR